MSLLDLENDPFFQKFIQRMARMLGEWYQSKANSMTNDELYADSEFFPMYDEKRDYSEKPDGYVCRNTDGSMMRLTHNSVSDGIGLLSSSIPANSIMWKTCWSTDPKYSKEFVSSETSPYMRKECCIYEGVIYRSLRDQNTQSPLEAPDSWEKIKI